MIPKHIQDFGYFGPTERDSLAVFVPGISSTFIDYMPFITELTKRGTGIVTYNHRDHGNSDGRFHEAGLVRDLEHIMEGQKEPVVLIGHSLGAGVAAKAKGNIKGQILIQPYLRSHSLSGINRLGLHGLRILEQLGVLGSIDKRIGGKRDLGFNNRHPLQDFAMLADFNGKLPQRPTAWAISDKDELIGTNLSKAHYESVKQRLANAYPGSTNLSKHVQGMNHTLNWKPYEFTPFFKSEPGKSSIVDAVSSFIKSCQ